MLMLIIYVPIFLARFFSIIVICSASFFRARENTNKIFTNEVHLGPDGPLQNTCQKGFSNVEKAMERSDHWN